MSECKERWAEIDKAKDESRHELVLSGEDVSTRIAKSGLDGRIFSLSNLNFLEISKTSLDILSDHVGNLENLCHLVLRCNKLRELPSAVGQLRKLKLLDASNNELTSLPLEVGSLKELQTLNVSCNKLSQFQDIHDLCQLHELDVSHNQLCELPPSVVTADLALLASIKASNNQITELPSGLSELAALKLLDVSCNCLNSIPAELADCAKLKELKVTGNKLKDRRLQKMVDQCATKSVLEYLRNILEKERKSKSGKDTKGSDRKDKKKGAKDKELDEDQRQNLIKVLHFPPENGTFVQVTANSQAVRPFIVCCIVHNLDFNKSESMMKRFILLQTKLHEGICVKRQVATIATHDLELCKHPLTYDARPPDELKIQPLGKIKEISASVLVARLRHEAEELRKEKKRNAISGIHKYLDLLKGKTLYPCLIDSTNTVISFPPITNGDSTKVSHKTKHILVEVTSSQSLDICKKVMDEFLALLLQMGIGQMDLPLSDVPAASSHKETDESEGGDGEVTEESSELLLTSEQMLVLEQVKIVDHLGILKVVYPSRVDLQSPDYRVQRDYE